MAYGRVGVCQHQTGSLTHWLINALNVVTGNIDSVGGAMFPSPPVDLVTVTERLDGKAAEGRYRPRVRGLPELAGELPVAGIADEILTPGAGQIRGMFIYAGNPVLSTPGGARLGEAMEQLEWCVAVDMYVNETTRHADVVLPPVAQLERSDVDLVFPSFSVRNQDPLQPRRPAQADRGKDDWEILRELAARLGRGRGGAIANALLRLLGPLWTPERVADLRWTRPLRPPALLAGARHGQGPARPPRDRPRPAAAETS